jgi:hypothetical protein
VGQPSRGTERILNEDDLDTVPYPPLGHHQRNTTIAQIQRNVSFVPGFSQPVADLGS